MPRLMNTMQVFLSYTPRRSCRKHCWSGTRVFQLNSSAVLTTEGCICKFTTFPQCKSLKKEHSLLSSVVFQPLAFHSDKSHRLFELEELLYRSLPLPTPTYCSTTYLILQENPYPSLFRAKSSCSPRRTFNGQARWQPTVPALAAWVTAQTHRNHHWGSDTTAPESLPAIAEANIQPHLH